MGVDAASRARAREERICRRAELDFGEALPAELGAPVVQRARESLELEDIEVAPDIGWEEALRRQTAAPASSSGSYIPSASVR